MLTGLILSLVGFALAIYFWLFFDITAPDTNFINLGLISDRQNGLIVGLGLAIVGLILAMAVKQLINNHKAFLQVELRIYGAMAILCGSLILTSMVSTWATGLVSFGSKLVSDLEKAYSDEHQTSPNTEPLQSSSNELGFQSNNMRTNSSSSDSSYKQNNSFTYSNSSHLSHNPKGSGSNSSSNESNKSSSYPDSLSGYDQSNTSDPTLNALKEQNGMLASEVKVLKALNLNTEKTIQRLEKQLADTKNTIYHRDIEISRLQNTLRITEDICNSKDKAAEDMRQALEKPKIENPNSGADTKSEAPYNPFYAQSLSINEFESYLKEFPAKYEGYQGVKAKAKANLRVPAPDAWTDF